MKDAAFAGLTLDVHFTAMPVDYPGDNRKPQPYTTGFSRKKRIEDRFHYFGIDT